MASWSLQESAHGTLWRGSSWRGPGGAPQGNAGWRASPQGSFLGPHVLVLQPGGLWILTVWWSRQGWQVYWKLANWQYLRDPQSSSMMHSWGGGRSSGKAGQQVPPILPPLSSQALGPEAGSSAPQAGGPPPHSTARLLPSGPPPPA